MAAIHFICRRDEHADYSPHPNLLYDRDTAQWVSGYWDVSLDDARVLVGGRIYLHSAKAEGAYFGGRIVEPFFVVQTTHAHELRIAFVFDALPSCRGIRWRGANHAMAWTSGVVPGD